MVSEAMTVDVELIQRIHREVWETTLYEADPHGEDIWCDMSIRDGLEAGDCEDWVDKTMDLLLSAGVDPVDISVALCHTKGLRGFDHAVCLVNAGGLGLMTCGDAYDQSGPRPVVNTGYSFDRFMKVDEPGVWRKFPDNWPYTS